MLNLPLALIGGVVGVYLAGGVLSVASIVGFITLFGIATRNGIMLISHIRHLRETGGRRPISATAVVRGATERLVPILMTALAAGLALVPIAMSMGEPGSEIQAPMAMVILFGLLSSTALNMIVVPVSATSGLATAAPSPEVHHFFSCSTLLEQMRADIRAVLFDLDGTLLDRRRSFERFVRDQWERFAHSFSLQTRSSTLRPL